MAETYTLYRHANMPSTYVVEAGDHAYLIPGIPGGWAQRKPYRGPRQSLRAIHPEEARVLAGTYGIPVQGGPRPGAGRKSLGDEPMQRRTVTLPPSMIADLERLGDGNLSAGIRALAASPVAPAHGCVASAGSAGVPALAP